MERTNQQTGFEALLVERNMPLWAASAGFAIILLFVWREASSRTAFRLAVLVAALTFAE